MSSNQVIKVSTEAQKVAKQTFFAVPTVENKIANVAIKDLSKTTNLANESQENGTLVFQANVVVDRSDTVEAYLFTHRIIHCHRVLCNPVRMQTAPL